MFNGLIKSMVLGIARNGAAAAGAWLVTHGYMAQNQMDGWLGSVMFLAALGFTVYDKVKVKQKLVTAVNLPPPIVPVTMADPLPVAVTMAPIPN